jgi:serine/threonine-protein kinase
MGLVSELRRRNVLRMAVLYVVAAWLIMQVAEVVIGLAELPGWIGIAILALLAVGFPIALIFSWFYELTAEGISLEKDIVATESITHATGRRMDFLVISLLCAAVILFAYDKWWTGPPPEQSIAVLPFVNMSNDPDNEYFSDGISEELLNVLAKIEDFRVTGRTSSFSFKGKDTDIQTIGEKLHVQTILEGSVRKAGDQVRITAQLVNVEDGYRLWSETYDRNLNNIFEVQDEIATAVVSALRLELPTRPAPSGRTGGVDPTAYRHYLQGRFLAHGSTADEIDLGLAHLRETSRLDPSFAPAYAAIADAMIVKAFFSTSPSAEIVGEARTAAQSAIALNPDLAEAYSALASIRMFFDFDWPGSEDAFRKAISLGPTSSTPYYRYANLLTGLARFDEAVRMAERAVEIDPIAIGALHALGLAKLFGGDFEGAVTAFDNAIEVHPDWTWGYVKKSLAHALIGQDTEALSLAEQTEKLTGGWGSAFLQSWLAWVYSVTEQDELLQRVAERINQGIEDNRIEDPFGVAVIYLAIGEVSMALDWAERTVNERSPNAVFWSVGTADHLKLAPAAFRESPRFIELLRRMDLPEH